MATGARRSRGRFLDINGHERDKMSRKSNHHRILIAMKNGIAVCEQDGNDWNEVFRGLTGCHVTSLACRNGLILAGTTEGIYASEGLNQPWRQKNSGLTARHIRSVAFHPEMKGLAVAGTEPAAIFVTEDYGENWRECPEVALLRDKYGWYLPYSPEAGCVRGFAMKGMRAYAAVEQGGALRSDDAGQNWRLVAGSTGKPNEQPPENIHQDVHSIQIHPSSEDLVFAPTGGGFYRSRDGGVSWQELYDCYCRAVWADVSNPDRIIFGPAEGVSAGGRVESTADGGLTWNSASDGLDIPWSHDMVQQFLQVGDHLIALLAGGTLYQSALDSVHWWRILKNVADAEALAVLE